MYVCLWLFYVFCGIMVVFYIYGLFKLILNLSRFYSMVEIDLILNKFLLVIFIIVEKNDC